MRNDSKPLKYLHNLTLNMRNFSVYICYYTFTLKLLTLTLTLECVEVEVGLLLE